MNQGRFWRNPRLSRDLRPYAEGCVEGNGELDSGFFRLARRYGFMGKQSIAKHLFDSARELSEGLPDGRREEILERLASILFVWIIGEAAI